MEVAALVISIVSLVVASAATIASLVYTHRSDERDQKRDGRDEASLRASREAQPTAAYLRRGTDERRSYVFEVANIGQAAATDLIATLIDSNGEAVDDLPQPAYLRGSGLLQPGERVEFELPVRADAQERKHIYLHFTWNDSLGTRREHTSRTVVPNH